MCSLRIYAISGKICSIVNIIISSQSSNLNLPVGTILPYVGKLSDIPSGWYLCDGSNGTPDLRDRFLAEAGKSYTLGDTGGLNQVILKGEEEGTHYHTFGFHNNNNDGYFLSTANQFVFGNTNFDKKVYPAKWNGSGGGGYWSWDGGSTFAPGQNLVTSAAISVAAKKPHENRPPYYAVYYIMRVK